MPASPGRVGVAANTLLFYVKGGGAWMHINHVQDILTAGATAATQSISDNRSGFVAGVGLEYALTENLSALFEYDFYDFGTKTENFNPTVYAAGDPLRSAHADGGSQLPLQLGLDWRAVLPNLLSPVFLAAKFPLPSQNLREKICGHRSRRCTGIGLAFSLCSVFYQG